MVTQRAPDGADKKLKPRFYIGPLHSPSQCTIVALRLHLYKSFASHSRPRGSEYNVGNCFQLDWNANPGWNRQLWQHLLSRAFISSSWWNHKFYLDSCWCVNNKMKTKIWGISPFPKNQCSCWSNSQIKRFKVMGHFLQLGKPLVRIMHVQTEFCQIAF